VVKVRYDEDVAGKVASLQRPVVIPDIVKLFKSMGDNLSVRWFKKEKLVSCVDSPVVIGKNSIGCLNLYYRRKYVFRKSDHWNSTSYLLGDEINFESSGTVINVEDIYRRVENKELLEFLQKKEKEYDH